MRQVSVALTVACLVISLPLVSAQQPRPVDAARADFLSVIARPRTPLAPSTPRTTTEGGYSIERVSFFSEPNEIVPLLIVRKGQANGRQPVVIGLHGTGGSKEAMQPLLQAYADRGFIGVGVDARHHGERATPIPGLANPYQSAMLRAYRSGEGHPYLYDSVWDVMRLIDYLSTRADVDTARIGVIGQSKGGTEAYLAAAADPRIAVVVPLIGVQSFGWSLRHPAGWEARIWTLRGAVEAAATESRENVSAAFVKKFYDRIAPGLTDRFDGPAILPLIAPRPMMIINGDSDPRSPLGGVREAVASAEKAYASAGARDKLSFILETDAAHEVTPEAADSALRWFVRWLSPAVR